MHNADTEALINNWNSLKSLIYLNFENLISTTNIRTINYHIICNLCIPFHPNTETHDYATHIYHNIHEAFANNSVHLT